MISWAEVCANPSLRDLPFKIETNRFNQIVMSPASFWHSSFQGKINALLGSLMKGGHCITECPIETADGTKVADVAWISAKRARPYREALSLPIAAEICVEVLSPSNTREEILAKMQLYFDREASEVWLCDKNGDMQFYLLDTVSPAAESRLCPSFPKHLDWE